MLIGFGWLAGFGGLFWRANRRFRRYLDELAVELGVETLAEKNRRTLSDGGLTAGFVVGASSLAALFRPAPTPALEQLRREAKSAFVVTYGYIPVTVVPVALIARIVAPVLTGISLPTFVPAIGLSVAIVISAVAGTQIAARLRRSQPIGLSQFVAALAGIAGIVLTLGAAVQTLR